MKRQLVTGLSVVLSLCLYAQDYHTGMEIVHPAKIALPDSAVHVLFVNNTVAHPDAPTAAFFTLMAASETMDNYGERIPSVLERTQNTSSSIYRKRFLTPVQADSLLNHYNADILVVLNQLLLHEKTESFLTVNDDFAAVLTGTTAANWSIYGRGTVSGRVFNTSDTLYWESTSMYEQEALDRLPNMEEVFNRMAVECGSKLVDNMSDQYEVVDRYLYQVAKDDEGFKAFTKQRWLEAIDKWKPYVDGADLKTSKQKQTAAHAAANTAVAYEIIGELSEAVFYARESERLFGEISSAYARQQQVNMRYYQGRLQSRLAELSAR